DRRPRPALELLGVWSLRLGGTYWAAMNSSRRAEAPRLRLVPPPGEDRERKPLPRLDDAQLVAALREGDASAAGAFYDRARPIVDRAIFRVLGRRDRDHD